MVLDNLGSSLQDTLSSLRGEQRVDEDSVDDVVQEIQRSLIQADVEVELVQELSNNIRDRSLNEEPPSGTSARDHVLRIVYEEMVEFIGESVDIPLDKNHVVLLAGLQGSGKTTTSAKIAWWFQSKGLKPAIIQTDTYRPGAYEQTKQMAENAEVDFYGEADSDDPVAIAENGLDAMDEAEVYIVDTAGRHALEQELIDEIKQIEQAIDPDMNMLVLDASIGQDAKEQAKQFQEAIGVGSISITKLDGTAKGGGALTAINETGSGIAFIGDGETVKDVERFEPEGFISRLLGMGDLKQLAERVERAHERAGDDDWEPEDMLEGEFTLYDMRRQIETMNEMGSMEKVLNMLPGMGGMGGMGQLQDAMGDKDLDQAQNQMQRFDIIMDSMTEEEMRDPSILNDERKRRIARGSGCSMEDVEQLLQQYNQMSTMVEQLQGGGLDRMQEQLGRGGGLGPFGD